MASTVDFQQCDYLDRHILPPALADERAELVHIGGQISSLDNHISQLTTLRHTLLRRSRQLHNMLSPIQAIPIEILSYIFQQLVNSDHGDYADSKWYKECLRQAFVLGSVSSYFRHVAFGTPELWKRIPLVITDGEAIGKASSLLRHCIALAPSVNIFICEEVSEEEARSAIDILLTPDTMKKVKCFELSLSSYAPKLWIDKFKGSCSPMLDTLCIACDDGEFGFDLGMLTTVTRLNIYAPWLDHSIIIPPSVQYLDVAVIPQQAFVSLLYQCPNLVECTIDVDHENFDGLGGDTKFTKPLTLPHLKHLYSSPIDAIMMNSSVENLRLPSLEILELQYLGDRKLTMIIPLCRNVSATLTTLVISMGTKESTYDDMSQLWRIPFLKLRKLEFFSFNWACFLNIVRALALLEGQFNNSNSHYCPALRSIILSCSDDAEPRSLVDLLKEFRIGEAFSFHIEFQFYGRTYCQWSPELQEELRSVLGSRQVEITWGNDEV